MNNIRYLLTGLSFFTAGFLFLTIVVKKIKHSFALSERDKVFRKRAFIMLSIILFVSGTACVGLSFIPDYTYKWSGIEEGSYLLSSHRYALTVADIDKQTFINYKDYFSYHKKEFEEKEYTVFEKELLYSERKRIQKYLESYNQAVSKNDTFLTVVHVSGSKGKVIQKLFLAHLKSENNALSIDYVDTYLEAIR
ncbi:hypothetical protein H0R92_02080 [Treponema sp. OMZ 840]|uniref:hypothetical protein n=1 Tax=Treponema sp. OMZ 840 TaxID=244313 RepID=UPI003D8AA286